MEKERGGGGGVIRDRIFIQVYMMHSDPVVRKRWSDPAKETDGKQPAISVCDTCKGERETTMILVVLRDPQRFMTVCAQQILGGGPHTHRKTRRRGGNKRPKCISSSQ